MSFENLPHNKKSFKLLMKHEFKTVLDIGSGKGNLFTQILLDNNKKVDSVDFFDGATYQGDYNELDINKKYDVIICYNILEHQHNAGLFLNKLHNNLKEGGLLSLSVPQWKDQIVDGHVSSWNAGLLLYNLILARWNCNMAKVSTFTDGNIPQINVLIQKKPKVDLPKLNHDRGDLYELMDYFPKDVSVQIKNNSKKKVNPFNGLEVMKSNFNGVIRECNWFVGFEKKIG